MRTPVVAGNWKMNTTLADAAALARDVRAGVEGITGVTTVVCPPAVSIVPVSMALEGSPVVVGAQDVNPNPSGAHTGELSAGMLAGLCTFVIVGHSERRAMYCEDDASTAQKAKAALAAGLRPIVCVGEALEIRENGEAESFVTSQVGGSLAGISDISQVAIAYEPVWAIGTGRAASPEVAQEMAAVIRRAVSNLYSEAVAEQLPVLYGGSVNAGNAATFAAAPDVDGALVGGASLDGTEFTKIVEAVAASG